MFSNHSVGNSHGQVPSGRTGRNLSHDIVDMPTSSLQLGGISMPIDPRYPNMFIQPDSRPFLQEQLAEEVNSIYAKLTMVKSKCIHVDRAQASAMRNAEKSRPGLADDHWQALIALHRTLLHEHHEDDPGPPLQMPSVNLSIDPDKKREWHIPGIPADVLIHAFPDYGSSRNAMSLPFVKENFPTHAIDLTSARSIKVGSGKTIQTLGELELPFQFEGEAKSRVLNFVIFPDCVHDVVLGGKFLRITRTLTRFKSRLREKLVACVGVRRLHLMGTLSEEIFGQVDGHLTTAFPDTGSDIMAMSSRFAEQRAHHIDSSQKNIIQVQFADGSYGWTKGKVSDVNWKFGYEKGPDASFKVDFYVLDELPCDIILSNEFLFYNDVFERYERFFIQFEDEGEDEEEGGEDDFIYVIKRTGQSLLSKAKKTAKKMWFKNDPPLGKYTLYTSLKKVLTLLISKCYPPNTHLARNGRARE